MTHGLVFDIKKYSIHDGPGIRTTKLDHARTGGTLLNQKFTPQLLHDEAGLDGLVQLVRTYFKLDGHHIQFNVVDAATLRAAQEHPEQHRDLIVRADGASGVLKEETRKQVDKERMSDRAHPLLLSFDVSFMGRFLPVHYC